MHTYPHRTYCDTLIEMRDILKHAGLARHTYNIILSLVEELQVYGNRMEAGLSYTRDLEELHKKRSKLNKEVKALAELCGNDKDAEQKTANLLAELKKDME